MDEWWPMLRSRIILWHCLIESNSSFIRDRHDEDSRIEPDNHSDEKGITKVINSELSEEAVSSIRRLINLNTNVAGGEV